MYQRGVGTTEISRKLGMQYSTVRNWVKYGIKPTNRESKRRYTYDEYINAVNYLL